MAGGLFARLKTWVKNETIKSADLNGEFNNIIQNLQPQYFDDYSHTVTQMRSTLSPGNVGTEVQAVNLAQEIQELRYQIQQLSGGAQWYSPPITSISALNTSVASVFPTAPNRVVGGARTSFDYPYVLVPTGTAPTVTLKGAGTPLNLFVNSAAVTFTADQVSGNLVTAPASNNTCAVLDLNLSGQAYTKTLGERGTTIQIGSVGSAISNKNGQYAAFKVGSEYFIGEINIGNIQYGVTFSNTGPTISASGGYSLNQNDQVYFTGGAVPSPFVVGTPYYVTPLTSTTFTVSATIGGGAVQSSSNGSATANSAKSNILQNCYRGYFFDNTGAGIPRVTLSNGTSFSLMNLTWVFATYNGSVPGLSITYNKPVVSKIQPSSPAVGDYWLDLSSGSWKQSNGSAYTVVPAVLIGVCIQDTTNTVGARTYDFALPYSELNTIELSYVDSADVRTSRLSDKLNVYGTTYSYDQNYLIWNTSTSLDTGVSLAASTQYFCYVSDLGQPFISDVSPFQRKFDLLGDYHPFKPYRCVGSFSTDSSSNIVSSSIDISESHQHVLGPGMVTTQKIFDGSVTAQKSGPCNYLTSLSTTTSGGTAAPLVLTLTTFGRPVMVGLMADGTSTFSGINVTSPSSGTGITFNRNGVAIANMNQRAVAGNQPPGMYNFLDDNAGAGLPAGTYTWSVTLQGAAATNVKLYVYEVR